MEKAVETKGGEIKVEKEHNLASEIWFREEAAGAICEMKITATVRAGNRTAETLDEKGGYKVGQFVAAKILNGSGEFADLVKEIVFSEVRKTRIKDLSSNDLAGTACGSTGVEELRKNLQGFYGRDFKINDEVTLLKFEYLDRLASAEDLARLKVLEFAQMPPDNPGNLSFEAYTLSLIEHDYPAKTPIMWNTAYREFGFNVGNVMLIGNPQAARQILEVLRRDSKYSGGGAGVGFKDEAVAHLDELDPLAKAIGAVNFILKMPDGRLRGFNTDGQGYAESLAEVFARRGQKLAGKKALVLGAGGSANAIAFALAEQGMDLFIANRTVSKAEELCYRLKEYFSPQGRDIKVSFGGEEAVENEVQEVDAVINVSTKGSAGPLERYSALAPVILPPTPENIASNLETARRIMTKIPRQAIISDIVLGEKPTPLLAEAKRAGFETLDGIPMVVNQGVESFFILHGEELKERGIGREDVYKVMRQATGF